MAKKNTNGKTSKAPKKEKPPMSEDEKRRAAEARRIAAAERAERRRALRAKLKAASAAIASAVSRFLWERSWMLSVPVGALLLLALGTYSAEDPSFSVSTAAQPANFCGLWGAWTADLMFSVFGHSAWWFVLGLFMVAFFAIRSACRRHKGETRPERINPPKFSALVGFCALLVGSTGLEALRLRRFGDALPMMPGGIMGDALSHAVVHYIGEGVAVVLFFVMIAIGLSLLLDFSWEALAERVGRWLDEVVFGFFQKQGRRGRDLGSSAGAAAPQQAARASGDSDVIEQVIPLDGSDKTLRIIRSKPREAAEPKPLFNDEILPAASKPGPVRPAGAQDKRLSLSLLDEPKSTADEADEDTIGMTSRLIVSKLKSYSIDAVVMGAQPGPVITQYWLEPGPGVKGAQIENIRDDLRRALGVQAVRIVLSIPGTSYIGLEVPNPVRQTVRLKEILKSDAYESSRSALTLAIGKDIAGKPFVMDLAKTPHLLVAGTTGSGKSVGINAMILSMLYRNDPSRLRLVLVDPKMLEFSLYNGIPHLLCPVVTDMNKAASALKWLSAEMDRRYKVMSKVGVRHFTSFNEKVSEAIRAGEPIRDPLAARDDPLAGTLEPWPYIVCVVDELADLMLTNRKEVEHEITRLTQKARAAGIHLILATQRPSVDVVTSLIKANVPTRISFQVASATDSRVILGESGAESLLGYGDMLLHRPGDSGATRIQGCFVADGEVLRVTDELRTFGSPEYVEAVTESPETAEGAEGASGEGRRSGESDPLYDQAVRIVLSEKRPTASFVQRQLGIGYNRASLLLEAMEDAGIVSKASASGKRTILVPTDNI